MPICGNIGKSGNIVAMAHVLKKTGQESLLGQYLVASWQILWRTIQTCLETTRFLVVSTAFGG